MNSWDFVRKWRVRATGAKVYFKTALIIDHTDVVGSKDPEQTSLYLWWRDKGKLVKNMEKEIKELEVYRKKMDSVIEGLNGNQTINISHVMSLLSSHQTHLEKLPNKIDDVIKVIESKRIDASLRRFDNWFWSYQKEQIFRLVIVEWFVPMVMGIWALYKTFPYNLFIN